MNETPFPQANDLNKVLIFLNNYSFSTQKELKNKMKLTKSRQIQYYKSACVFLGFINNTKELTLTRSGKKITRTSHDLQKEIYILELIKTPVLKKIVFNYDEKKIMTILENTQSFKKLSPTTKKRRVSTIKSWVKWLNKNI